MVGMKPLSEMGRYATVVIDPPWPLKPFGLRRMSNGKSVDNYAVIQYDTMPIDAIADLPISEVLAEDALVFCWTVNKFLPYTFHIMGTWGVTYAYTMTWIKNGGIQTPTSPQFNSEWVVVGRKGKPQYTENQGIQHSQLLAQR